MKRGRFLPIFAKEFAKIKQGFRTESTDRPPMNTGQGSKDIPRRRSTARVSWDSGLQSIDLHRIDVYPELDL